MANLTPEEIAYLAQNANAATRNADERGFSSTRKHRGFREDATAVAVAMAESGGNPRAHNTRPPDNSYGLWQINMYGNLGPARRKQFGLSSNDQLFNPAVNADAAYQVFLDAGKQFTPWSVFLSGSYLQHMPAAMRAVGAAKQPEGYPGGTLPDSILPDPLQNLADVFGFITDPSNWKRLGLIVGGGLVILLAVVFLGAESGVAGKAINAVPVGRVASKAVRKVT